MYLPSPLKSKIFIIPLILGIMTLQAKAQNGDHLFDDTLLHKIEFFGADISQISNLSFKGIYQPVEIRIDGNVIKQVGLTTKGEKSWLAAPNDKKPFKIKTDQYIQGQKYDGIKRFNLHNNTYDRGIMREKLTCDASQALGIPAPRIAFAEVFINGDYWGIYTLVEAQDEIYKRSFGNNNGYTMESFGGENNLQTLMYYGDHSLDYKGHYIVDHGNDSTAWSLWIDLLYKIHSFPPRFHYVDSISKYIDYQSYFQFNAVLDYNLNAESKDRNGIFYYEPGVKKWITICWDQNVSFADFTDPNQHKFPNTQCTAFLDKYSTYTAFQEVYDNTMCQLVHTVFSDSVLNSRVMTYRKIIDPAVERDLRKGFTFQQYEQSLLDLRNFIATRNQVTLQFLKDKNYSCTTTGLNSQLQDHTIEIYPIPANDLLNVMAPEKQGLDYSINNLQGAVVLKDKVSKSQISISTLPPGVYVLEIFLDKKRLTVRKIIKQ